MTADATTFACPPSLWRAVASSTGREWPPQSPEDVEDFVRALDRQRLLALAGRDPGLPADVRQHVARRYADDAARAERVAREQDDTLAVLAEGLRGDWLVVNGADYRTRLYPARPLSSAPDSRAVIENIDLDVADSPIDARSLNHLTITDSRPLQDYLFRRIVEVTRNAGG